jgi:hypothetical protein
MEREIHHIAVLPAAKVLAAVYGVALVVVSPFLVVVLALGRHSLLEALGLVLLLLVAYPIMGYLQGAVLAALYNVIASRVGGLRITVEQTTRPIVPPNYSSAANGGPPKSMQ